MSFHIPGNQSNYLHMKARKCIWGPKTKDAKNLKILSQLIKIQFPENLVEIESDNEGHLKNFIISTTEMKQAYSRFNDVILIDTTYNTNRYKMPLIVVGGVDSNSKTFLLGFGTLHSEKICDVQWVLEKLFSYLGTSPSIICTDSCPTLKKVISDILPQSTHLLCGWHVSMNIKKNLSGLSIFLFYSLIINFLRK